LSLTLDEEVQLRCAGFVLAEAERFTEEVAVLSEVSDGSDDERASSDNDAAPKKGAGKGGKKATNGTKETGAAASAGMLIASSRVFGRWRRSRHYLGKQTTRTELEQEYVFMGVVSTFLRAIRAGAIHPRHSAVLLTHHGRLGVAFDHCSKVVVDVLREEGMYKGHGDIVVDVITSALKDVSNIILPCYSFLFIH
jgi:cohesin complex subunit SA-1/2